MWDWVGAQTCGRYALHPRDLQQREQHGRGCEARAQRGAALQASRQVECAICLERVLDKADATERQFGLLDCEHAFCLCCIRGWRSHLEGGADLDSVRSPPPPPPGAALSAMQACSLGPAPNAEVPADTSKLAAGLSRGLTLLRCMCTI